MEWKLDFPNRERSYDTQYEISDRISF